ncbi:MAG: PAS domain S-box protein, partial [Planctomycetota bacterium]
GLGGIVVGSRHLRRQVEHRQQAEEALEESEARVKETASHIPGVVYQFVLHPDGSTTFPYVSEGVTKILGPKPEEVRRDSAVLFPGLVFEEDLDSVWQSIHESAEKMSTWQREMRCKSTRGETKWIRATSSPHPLPDGSVLWNGVFLDITDHKEADRRLQEAHDLLERRVAERTTELEEANRELHKEIADRKQAEKWLLESEERFRSFFELGVVGMAIISPEKDWDEANDRLCEILGYSQEELIGKTWTELVHPEDREADEEQFNRALAGLVSGYSMHRRFVGKDGQTVYADLSVRCLRRADGTVDSLIVLVQDRSEHTRAEEEVRSIQAKLSEQRQEG